MKRAILAASVMTASVLLVSTASAQRSRSEIGHGRCNRMLNQFVFNKANVNALVALQCAALSHVENERVGMDYESSATMHHQWQTLEKDGVIFVKGHCAVPLQSLGSDNLGRHEIDLAFVNRSQGEIKALGIKGSIVGKSVELEFSNNQFVDESCGRQVQRVSQLSSVNLGLSFSMQSLADAVRSRRTGTLLRLAGRENWVQGNSSHGFSQLGVVYRMSQINGRQLGLSMTGGELSSSINIRSMNFLDYAEGGGFLALKYDVFGHAQGYLKPDLPVNHRFASVAIEGGSQIRGCSSLVYEGELSQPVNADYMNCIRRIENSKLQQYAKTAIRSTPKVLTEAEKEKLRTVREEQMIAQKAQIRISQMTPKARNYSDRPGVFEQGRMSWSHEDRERGFVVQQRSYSLDQQRKVMVVVEHRSNANGVKSTERVEIPFSEL
jgi:hypothetical protein